ncbi:MULTISPECIES: orotidine-5'-phosphate decarboxylase [unclassified Leptolyngbya]|uniref:orotidine-5'-phosphate decarboxylase n=1 Tax=unclassified Leptolyngbya TaxID=2650499 RepID=UPI001684C94B|nr:MULTISPECIES: orotidine-5'-phosphate decarboxylase [unclassified Leptolyngbya]MBD1912729.1 orotidine-5'-phosphate decarboxylase [Leptolyngbya sp. FACHB-8]MBD2154648.1 orotidine-5'-phosphate decarboxylase [Leptolyngbya sp. FACHB-16]
MTHTLALRDRIIVPLDVPSEAEAIALLDRLPDVSFWKVGLELFVSTGPTLLTELQNRGKRIFLDLKFHDIPNTMAGACRAAGRYGVNLLTVHATAGKAALTAAVAAAAEGAAEAGCNPPAVIAVTVLTSIDSQALAFELKVPLELPDYALQMALLAQTSGLSGIVCSPKEASQIRDVCGGDFLRVCPGVRPAWAEAGDQRRSLTPSAAFQAGASYLVIGRPITAAPDPAAAFARICNELEA